MTSPSMQITGERTVPGIAPENYWFRRHEVVYEYVVQQLGGEPRRVLEAGCGEGYGADLMRRHGHRIIALDYDAYAVSHVRARYGPLPLVRGNLVSLPFAGDSFGAVVSLQTIEHLWDQPQFVAECCRVVSPGGAVVLSTPNRLTFPPGNIFHTRELDPAELSAVARHHGFRASTVGVDHGTRIQTWEDHHGSLVGAQLAVPPCDWDDNLTDFVRSVTTADFAISAECLDSALDLVTVLVASASARGG